LFKSNGKSFHPKAYLFDIPDEHGYFIVGSSNLSRSALKTGTEWNLGRRPTYLELHLKGNAQSQEYKQEIK
jgi:HKD family nuclease